MKALIVANWKLDCNLENLTKINKNISEKSKTAEILIAVPYVYIHKAYEMLDRKLNVCAQDISHYEKGPYTGEVSPIMLQEVGIKYCIVGHSERYIHFNETFSNVNQKIKLLSQYHIRPILCVGEPKSLKPAQKSPSDEKEDVSAYFENPNKSDDPVDDKKDGITSYLYQAKKANEENIEKLQNYIGEMKEKYKPELDTVKEKCEAAKNVCKEKLENMNIIDNKPHLTYIKNQLETCLADASGIDIDIAYEPQWAVGGSTKAPNDHILEAVGLIKNIMIVKELKGRILYGGSINSRNVSDLNYVKDLNGIMVGQASLTNGFDEIIQEYLA